MLLLPHQPRGPRRRGADVTAAGLHGGMQHCSFGHSVVLLLSGAVLKERHQQPVLVGGRGRHSAASCSVLTVDLDWVVVTAVEIYIT